MSTDALITLKQGTDKADRFNIFLLAKQSCSENQDYPTKKMIEKAKLDYQNTIHDDLEANVAEEAQPLKKKKAKSKTKNEEQQLTETDQLQDSDCGSQKQPDEEDEKSRYKRYTTKILNRIAKEYSLEDRKKLLNQLKPLKRKDKDAAQLLHYLNHDQLLKVIKCLERNTSITLS